VERKTGLSGTRILARMNSQTAVGQIESAYAVLGYTIRSSQLRFEPILATLRHLGGWPNWALCARTREKGLLNAVNLPLPSYPESPKCFINPVFRSTAPRTPSLSAFSVPLIPDTQNRREIACAAPIDPGAKVCEKSGHPEAGSRAKAR
jgi:hypothetical protein